MTSFAFNFAIAEEDWTFIILSWQRISSLVLH